ncbi:unnamed protein product [Caenorhabditis nigoni]
MLNRSAEAAEGILPLGNDLTVMELTTEMEDMIHERFLIIHVATAKSPFFEQNNDLCHNSGGTRFRYFGGIFGGKTNGIRSDKRCTIPDALNAPQASDEETRMVRGCVKREEPELNAPIESNMEQVARNNKRYVEEEKDDLEEQPATVEQSSSFTKMIECRLCNRKIIKSNSFYHKAHAAAHLRLKTWKCTVCETIGLEALDSQRLDSREKPRWKS